MKQSCAANYQTYTDPAAFRAAFYGARAQAQMLGIIALLYLRAVTSHGHKLLPLPSKPTYHLRSSSGT